jgi:hypothetical protein
MPYQRRALDRRILLISVMLLPPCLTVSACGGGGSSFVASVPPPPALPATPTPTPTPTPRATIQVQTSWLDSPATRVGGYDAIGIVNQAVNGSSSSRSMAPGEFRINTAQAGQGIAYTLSAPSAFLPTGLSTMVLPVPQQSWDFNVGGPNFRYDNPYGDYIQFFGQNLKEYEILPDGTKTLRQNYDFTLASFANGIIDLPTGQRISESATYDLGLSYVTMGEWGWSAVSPGAAPTPTGGSNSIYFVYGDRTPSSGIPVSGTATYDARTLTLWSHGAVGIPFALTADFGQRTMSTRIDQDYLYTSQVDATTFGIHVGGSAPFTNDGLFDIGLSGTANYSANNSPQTPPSQAVTGAMNGAFFGPHAEQVGGTFSLQNSGGATLMQDAFVGQQHH